MIYKQKPSTNAYFKKTWCGQVLMVLQYESVWNKDDDSFEKQYYYRKATEQEAQSIKINIEVKGL